MGKATHTFANSLHGAHLGAIFHLVDGEVNLRQRLLLLYCANGIVDLDIARVLRTGRTSAVCVHGGRRGVPGQDREGTPSGRAEMMSALWSLLSLGI